MSIASDLPERIALSRANAQALLTRISKASDASEIQDAQTAIVELEKEAIDLFSTFEARMQNHFKRGPFSRKLKARLIEANEPDLADRVNQYYLAINVLKHGKGTSYRELLHQTDSLITLKPSDETEDDAVACLIEVTAAHFFDGLCDSLLQAYDFLKAR